MIDNFQILSGDFWVFVNHKNSVRSPEKLGWLVTSRISSLLHYPSITVPRMLWCQQVMLSYGSYVAGAFFHTKITITLGGSLRDKEDLFSHYQLVFIIVDSFA